MENETLTTEVEESQVNTDEVSAEVVSNETETTPDEGNGTGSKEYNDAWDNIDVDNFTMPEETTNEVVEETPQVDLNQAEVADVNDIKETMNAFMTDQPVLKFKGKDIPIDSPDELIALAQKGFLLETEMSKIKPMKKIGNIVKDIPTDVLQSLADLHNGNKSAIEYIKDKYGIAKEDAGFSFMEDEPAQQQDTGSYKPEVKAEDPVAELWNEFIDTNPTESGKVNEIYSQLDEGFKAEIDKPEVFPQFINSVVTGEFDSVYPLAMKERAVNPTLTWLQAYSLASSKVGSKAPEAKKPTKAMETPQNNETGRKVSPTATADRVWEDDSYFKELEKEIFNF
jgi:hypothetical protein